MSQDTIIEDTDAVLSADFMRILSETETRVRHSAHAHWLATNRFEAWARWTTFLTLIGGFLISSLSALPVLFKDFYVAHSESANIALFALGGFVSVISILQAVQRWSERSQLHSFSANAYSSLRRELEILRLNLPESQNELTALLERLRILGEDAPPVPGHLYREAVAGIK